MNMIGCSNFFPFFTNSPALWGSVSLAVRWLCGTWGTAAGLSITLASFWLSLRPTWQPSKPLFTTSGIPILLGALPRQDQERKVMPQLAPQTCRFFLGRARSQSSHQPWWVVSKKEPPSSRKWLSSKRPSTICFQRVAQPTVHTGVGRVGGACDFTLDSNRCPLDIHRVIDLPTFAVSEFSERRPGFSGLISCNKIWVQAG